MPRLLETTATGRHAGLVPSFPCFPETVESVALKGIDRLVDHGLSVERDDSILEAARRFGMAAPQRVAAARKIDEGFARRGSGLSGDEGLLIVGAPGLRPAGKIIDLEPLSSLPGWRWEPRSAVLQGENPSAAGEVNAARSALLHLRGIERVLHGESLAAWSAAGGPSSTPRAWGEGVLVALARRGFSFEEEAASIGHPEIEESEQGLLLWIGPVQGDDWPSQLHDFRIAPSLAQALDQAMDTAPVRPFPL